MDTLPDGRLLSRKSVLQFTEFSNSYLYELIAAGDFPRPLKFGRASRWLSSEVQQAIEQRAAQRAAA